MLLERGVKGDEKFMNIHLVYINYYLTEFCVCFDEHFSVRCIVYSKDTLILTSQRNNIIKRNDMLILVQCIYRQIYEKAQNIYVIKIPFEEYRKGSKNI